MRSSQASRKKAKEKKLVRVGIQVPPEVKQRWEAMAEENGRSVSEWCRWQIEKVIQPNHRGETERGPAAHKCAIR